MSTLTISLTFLALLGGALWLRQAPEPRRAAAAATLLSGVAAAGTLVLIAAAASGAGDLASRPGDLLVSALLGAVTTALFVMCLGAPRSDIDADRLARAFAVAAMFAAACLANGARPLAVIVVLSAVPLLPRGRLAIVPVLGSAIMAAGLLWLAHAGWSTLPLAQGAPAGPIAVVWIGAWMRLGLLPFQGWLPVLFERGYPAKSVVAFIANPALLVMLRVCTGTAWMSGPAGQLFTGLAALSALYGSFLCLGQRDLLRAIGWQALASTGLVATGICSREPEGVAGAVVHVAASSLFIAGLTLVAWTVRARFGAAATGVGHRVRHAGAAFLLFGLAAAGFPGTLCFVSEDLLLHGVIEHRPVIGMIMALTTALSAIAMLRLYFTVLMGPSRAAPARPGLAREVIPDLFPREKAAFGVLLAALFGLGLAPAPPVRAAELVAAAGAESPP